MIVPPRSPHSFRLFMIRHDIVIIGELFTANRADAVLFDDLSIHQLPHLCWRPQLTIASGVVIVLHALHPESYEPRLVKGCPSAAGERFMHWTEFH
jgi:hypothetical protein